MCLQLTVINLGNNIFEEVPEQLKYLQSLKKLYLFGNQVAKISPEIFGKNISHLAQKSNIIQC